MKGMHESLAERRMEKSRSTVWSSPRRPDAGRRFRGSTDLLLHCSPALSKPAAQRAAGFNRGNWRLLEPRVRAVGRFMEALIGPPDPYLSVVTDLARRDHAG